MRAVSLSNDADANGFIRYVKICNVSHPLPPGTGWSCILWESENENSVVNGLINLMCHWQNELQDMGSFQMKKALLKSMLS